MVTLLANRCITNNEIVVINTISTAQYTTSRTDTLALQNSAIERNSQRLCSNGASVNTTAVELHTTIMNIRRRFKVSTIHTLTILWRPHTGTDGTEITTPGWPHMHKINKWHSAVQTLCLNSTVPFVNFVHVPRSSPEWQPLIPRAVFNLRQNPWVTGDVRASSAPRLCLPSSQLHLARGYIQPIKCRPHNSAALWEIHACSTGWTVTNLLGKSVGITSWLSVTILPSMSYIYG